MPFFVKRRTNTHVIASFDGWVYYVHPGSGIADPGTNKCRNNNFRSDVVSVFFKLEILRLRSEWRSGEATFKRGWRSSKNDALNRPSLRVCGNCAYGLWRSNLILRVRSLTSRLLRSSQWRSRGECTPKKGTSCWVLAKHLLKCNGT